MGLETGKNIWGQSKIKYKKMESRIELLFLVFDIAVYPTIFRTIHSKRVHFLSLN